MKVYEEFPSYFLHEFIDKMYFLLESLNVTNLETIIDLCGNIFSFITTNIKELSN